MATVKEISAFWEDEDGEAVRIIHMLLQPLQLNKSTNLI